MKSKNEAIRMKSIKQSGTKIINLGVRFHLSELKNPMPQDIWMMKMLFTKRGNNGSENFTMQSYQGRND